MPAPEIIHHLVQRFTDGLAVYRSSDYKEAHLRHEFIDPFFEALGWDVYNKQGYAEAYKQVVVEDSLKIGAATKAPDYAFRIGGVRKFFVEAKAASVKIKDEISPAFQLRRYAWSAKLPLSILTDFEEFAVYDCRGKPDKSDKAAAGRILYFGYRDYASRWDELAATFSPQAILTGAFDKFAETSKTKHGTAEVDDAFLAEIERWRDILARNIALRNPQLSHRDLNYAVQMTIDRIIFLRICEDRGIELYGQLQSLVNGNDVYPRLCQFFRKADERYNSGLFHFRPEKGQADAPDQLTPGLQLDDKPLKDILGSLYYPDSPYEFSVLPADILGQVYEQFLGKVIRLTSGHRAVVEEKPEVKKAGGVFYTPTYIVEYIVKHTLGARLEGKQPGDPGLGGKGEPLRVADPACGSGSFLLGAYQYLLDWYRDGYLADPGKWAKGAHPRLVQLASPPSPAGRGAGGEVRGEAWRLTTTERKRILLDHIYGVDIDPQAVEVTKLSLLLKVLEGESEQSLAHQLSFWQTRALPDLAHNIQCGNSLIGPDFYSGTQISFLDSEEQYRINAFDWPRAFPQVFSQSGGFDVIIGNPPYGAYFGDTEKAYIKGHYRTYQYKFDSYIYFIERSMGLLKQSGYLSFITPELWLRLENSASLRRFIAQTAGFDLLKICGENVFATAVVNTVVFRLQRGTHVDALRIETNQNSWLLPSNTWQSTDGLVIEYRIPPGVNSLIEKIRSTTQRTLSDYGEAIQGITPYDKYRGQDEKLIKRRGYHYSYKHDDTCGKWLSGKDVSRYELKWSGEWLSYGTWLGAPREPRFFEGPRLLFREVPGAGKRIQATIAEEICYHGHSITPFKIYPDSDLDLRYILGLVNSKLLSWYGGLTLPNFGKDVFPKLNPQDIKALRIRPINFSNPADAARHARMVALVEHMLALHPQLAAAKTPSEKTHLQRQVEATDQQIDALVYELYGLTQDEIRIVEGKN